MRPPARNSFAAPASIQFNTPLASVDKITLSNSDTGSWGGGFSYLIQSIRRRHAAESPSSVTRKVLLLVIIALKHPTKSIPPATPFISAVCVSFPVNAFSFEAPALFRKRLETSFAVNRVFPSRRNVSKGLFIRSSLNSVQLCRPITASRIFTSVDLPPPGVPVITRNVCERFTPIRHWPAYSCSKSASALLMAGDISLSRNLGHPAPGIYSISERFRL